MTDHIVVVEIDANGGNSHHVLPAARHADWRRAAADGTSGQDRQSYSDDQDRDGYSVDGSADEMPDELLDLVRAEGREFDTWAQATAHVASIGGTVVDVIAVRDDQDED